MTEHSQHTPGPWKLEGRYVLGPPRDNFLDGHIERLHIAVAAIDPKKGETTEQAANARLIAAAPCLLHELRTSRCPGGGYTGQPEGEDPTVENCLKAGNCGCSAGAAVTKATGANVRIAERERG